MNKTAAQYKQADRRKKREAGFVLKQIWVKPKQWPKIKKYIDGVKNET